MLICLVKTIQNTFKLKLINFFKRFEKYYGNASANYAANNDFEKSSSQSKSPHWWLRSHKYVECCNIPKYIAC